MKSNKKYSIILSLLCVLYSIFLLSVPILTSALVDNAIEASKIEEPDLSKLYFSILFVVIAIGVDAILYALEQYFYFKFAVILEKQKKETLFYEMFSKEYQALNMYHSAEIEQLFTTDIQNLIRKELDTIPAFVRQATRLLLAIIMVLLINYLFLLLILGCGLIGLCLAKLYSKWIRPHHSKVLSEEGRLNGFIIEAANQTKLLQAYDALEFSNEHFDKLNQKQLVAKKKRNRIFFLANSGVFGFSSILYLIALCYGGYGIATKALTYGSMIALVQLLNNIQDPLLSFSSLWNQLNLAKTSLERIQRVLSLEQKSLEAEVEDFDALVFEDINFSYGEKKVLTQLSFEIKKGEIALIDGPSGIGKTTLFMLALGFLQPNEGRIYFKKGKEIFPLSKAYFSYVPQEPILFSGTIKENIYILTGKTVEEAMWALKMTNIYDELIELPQGFNTILKERGSGLSIGQIQRLLIAIAIVKDRPILLLDEFSSALDQANEANIIQELTKLKKTILYISHRNQMMPNHRVIHIKEGQDDEE